MEQLVLEVRKLRKQLEFQGRIVGILAVVLIVAFVGPFVFQRDHRQSLVSTELVNARQIRLTSADGRTAVLTSDSLTFSGPPSSPVAVAVSIGVDRDRQPRMSLYFEGDNAASGRARSATLMIHRSEGLPDATFIDADGREIPWIED